MVVSTHKIISEALFGMILPQAWHSEMVFLRNEVSLTCGGSNVNKFIHVVMQTVGEVGSEAAGIKWPRRGRLCQLPAE